MTQAYVLVSPVGGSLGESPAQLITAARVFGDVTAVLVAAPGAEALVAQLGELGAAEVVLADPPAGDVELSARLLLPEVDAVAALAAEAPAPILVAAGPRGNEVAGRLSARLASGALYDVVAIAADGSATQSVFGDQLQVTSVVGGASPVYSVRTGAIEADPQPAAGTVRHITLPPATVKDVHVDSFEPAARSARPALGQAKIVVAGGRGVGSEENFHALVEKLADSLGAAVGATRDAVDNGYYGAQFQIGQTGHTISPDLYIGLGVSGAIQHLSGMQTAKKIVVINNDEDAPIHQIADLSAIADLFDVVPELIDEIDARRR